MAQSHRPAMQLQSSHPHRAQARSQSDEIIINLDRHAVDLQHERRHLITVEMKGSLWFEGESAL